MAPKKGKGKGKVDAIDTAPAGPPEDLPKNSRSSMSWRNPGNNNNVLRASSTIALCWSHAYTRMIEAHLRIHDKVGRYVFLSEKHLYGHIKEKIKQTGYLKSYEGIKEFLENEGMIEEDECKCTQFGGNLNTKACDKIKDKQVFKISKFVVVTGKEVDEQQIIGLLQTHGPIAVLIKVDHEYRACSKDEIYFGPKMVKPMDQLQENHIVLLTGFGTKEGIYYFEFQNSWGSNWGIQGFGKFARKISLPKGEKSLIVEYMYPELLKEKFALRS